MERRKHPRIPYGAWVEDLSNTGGINFYLAKNLSLGGMLLVATDPPQIGIRVHLRLIVENERRIMAVDGEIVRHTTSETAGNAFAVRFINLDLARQAFLEELLKECEQPPEGGPPPPTEVKEGM